MHNFAPSTQARVRASWGVTREASHMISEMVGGFSWVAGHAKSVGASWTVRSPIKTIAFGNGEPRSVRTQGDDAMGGINSGPHRSTRLRFAAAKRFDVSQLQRKAVAEQWPEGAVHRLSFEPYPGRLITARVELTFILPGGGGRRYYWLCPECGRKARFLYGGRPDLTKPNRIACSACQRLLWPSQH